MCVPKLRFPEFDGGWEENRLNELYEIKNGLNKEKEFFGTGIKILNYMDINLRVLNDENMIEGLVEVNESELNRFNVKPNDLFFTRTSETSEEIGFTSSYMGKNIDCVFSGFILRARPKIVGINSLFYAYYFRNPQNRYNIIKNSSITTRALIAGSNLSKMKIKYPDINEQQKIASFLSKVDSKIEKLEKKQELWKTYKKGIMQQIFSQKLRFKDENGKNYPDWEEKKFVDICSIQMGQSPSSKNYTENPNDTILIQGNADLNDGKIIPRVYTTEITKKSDPDDIIMTVRAPVGDIALNQYFACIGRGVCAIKGEKFIYYLLYYIKMRNIWKKISQGSTIDAVSSADIKNLKILNPSLQEQAKITKFLSDINRKIDFLDKELKINIEFKKGLLQKMFC